MTNMRCVNKQLSWILAVVFVFTGAVIPANAQGPTNFANCRLGVGGANDPDLTQFNVEQLNMGLYLDWKSRDAPPTGLPADVEYFQIVRVHQDKVGDWDTPYVDPPTYTVRPNLNTLVQRVADNPGSLWFIGNEIDRRDWSGGGQDDITPELYATAFHEIREVIKAADPTARIGIGSVVEATPLRLKYLDRVWDSYFSQYGYPMGDDIDVWNVHGFILREVSNSWGAEPPAGLLLNVDFEPAEGFLYGADIPTVVAAHHDISYFQQFTRDLRAWMAAHGERNKPLINTEYGILYKKISGEQITREQVSDYLTASFDYLLNATDAAIGYPADENRLVQGWVWYSLDDKGWNGNLFDPTSKALTDNGTTWKNYISDAGNPLASQPRQNLLVTNLRATPNPAYVFSGGTLTATLTADIANSGNIQTNSGDSLAVSFWDGDPNDPGSNQIGSTQILADLPGCGGVATVAVQWPDKAAGDYPWYVKVEPVANEATTGDNIASDVLSIGTNVPVADLGVTKTVDNSAPYEGIGTVKYTITASNSGPDPVFNVEVNDLLPAGVTFKSYAASQGVYYTAGLWTVGTLSNGAEAVLTITARVKDGQAGNTITNSASVSSSDRDDAVPTNDAAEVDIVPLPTSKVYLPVVAK